MTAQHAAARRPWHEAVRDGLRCLRARAAMLARRPSWFRVPVIPGCLPLFPVTRPFATDAEAEAVASLIADLADLETPAPAIADGPGQAPAPWDEEAALRRAMHSALFWADPETPAPAPAQDEAATAVPATDAATLPLPPADPPSAAGGQGQPYADWPQPPPGALIIATSDGAVEYRRPDAIITVRATPGGGTSTEVWTPRRRQLDTVAWLDLRVVPRWYEAWLAEHPEAEAAA